MSIYEPIASDDSRRHLQLRSPVSLEVNDEVLFGKYGGTEVEVDGDEYKILRESDILAKVAR